MHAVIMHEFGTADVLRPGEFPDPTETAGWVTVRLHASALNWHDVLVRQGRYASPLPHIIGADGAGVRTDTGEPVVVLPSLNWGDRDEAPGDRWEILGDHTPGTYAELVSVPADCVAPKPAGLSWSEAAALAPTAAGGRLVVLGANAAQTRMDIRSFYFGQFDLLGTTMGSSRDFAGLLNMIDRCAVRPPVIDREFPLDRAAEAHEYLENGRTFGKGAETHLGGAP